MKQLYQTFIITLFSAVLVSCGGAGAPAPSKGARARGEGAILTWIKAGGTSRTEDLNSVSHNGTRFVVVGTSGAIYYSDNNGKDWTPSSNPDRGEANHRGEQLKGVSYGGNRFVAVGDSGAIYYSDDGETWKEATNPDSGARNSLNPNHRTETLFGVSHKGSRFVAVGDSGAIYYSDDGETWKEATNPDSGARNSPNPNHRGEQLKGVSYGGTRFVAVGESGAIYYSDNGESWAKAGGTRTTLWGVSYGGSRFVTVGYGSAIYYSDKGEIWAEAPNPPSYHPTTNLPDTNHRRYRLTSVSYGGTRFVAVGDSGAIYYNDKGEIWLAAPNPSSSDPNHRAANLRGVSYGGSRFVVVGSSGAIYYSTWP